MRRWGVYTLGQRRRSNRGLRSSGWFKQKMLQACFLQHHRLPPGGGLQCGERVIDGAQHVVFQLPEVMAEVVERAL